MGFDWPSIHGVADKVEEELEELSEEINRQSASARLADESGDLLFAAVNLVRHAGVDPEPALRQANSKFTRRFHQVEAFCHEAGQSVSETSLDTLDLYWEKAKRTEHRDRIETAQPVLCIEGSSGKKNSHKFHLLHSTVSRPMGTENRIEVENLVAHYGDRVILNGIDMDVRAGEIMVIMGGSGSGKTTLMRNLLGLNQPTSGKYSGLRQGHHKDQQP